MKGGIKMSLISKKHDPKAYSKYRNEQPNDYASSTTSSNSSMNPPPNISYNPNIPPSPNGPTNSNIPPNPNTPNTPPRPNQPNNPNTPPNPNMSNNPNMPPRPNQPNMPNTPPNPNMPNNPNTPPRPNPSYTGGTNNTYSQTLKDYGPSPLVVDISNATKNNSNFRTALWTGSLLQLTLMSIPPGESIGLEMHPDVDQFVRIESGQGLVMMGDQMNNLDFRQPVNPGYAFIIPAGKWHNLVNTGNTPLKLYSLYAPPNHPFGTIHVTKADADAAES